jgi:carbon-monoxide dehydrogenase medium subunit
MYPDELEYYSAESLGEARELLAANADRDARLLAGGSGLVTSMKFGEASPDVLVDVSGVDSLSGIDVGAGGATVGALTTHAELVDEDLTTATPILPAMAEHVADRQVRNRGTLGGNLAEADPCADPPAAVLAAEATLVLDTPSGERSVDATEFFRGDGETTLSERDIITAIRVPEHDSAAYEKKIHPASGYAMVGVAAVTDVEDGVLTDAGVAVTGVHDPPVRLRGVEEAVEGTALDDVDPAEAVIDAAAELDPDGLIGDVHASGTFRAELVPTYVERSLREALDGDWRR